MELKRIFTDRPLNKLLILAVSAAAAVLGLVGPWYQKIFVDGLLEWF
jgi:hypothetical protein